jgi:hypothetical protein
MVARFSFQQINNSAKLNALKNMQDLISAWRNFDHTKNPYLDGDEIPQNFIKRHNSWEEYISNPNFGDGSDATKLHLDLLPIPFVGNLKTASVYLLMQNPGFGHHDYFSEFKIPEYRAALLNNLRQTESTSFFFLDSQFSWHGGYQYWHKKLHKLIKKFSKKPELSISYGQALNFFRKEIAVVELVPYHSVSFDLPEKIIRKLKSAHLAREFVKEQAETKDCLVVVTRSVKQWKLSECKNIICFNSKQARSAHLSAQEDKILEFLGKRFATHNNS